MKNLLKPKRKDKKQDDIISAGYGLKLSCNKFNIKSRDNKWSLKLLSCHCDSWMEWEWGTHCVSFYIPKWVHSTAILL